MLLKAIDAQIDLSEPAGALPAGSGATGRVHHPPLDLLRQRLFGLVCTGRSPRTRGQSQERLRR